MDPTTAPAEVTNPEDGSHRRGRGFYNPWGPQSQPGRLGSVLKWILIDRPQDRRGRTPDRTAFRRLVQLAAPTYPAPRAGVDDLTITWVGHSTFLIQIGGRNLLVDPVWSTRASPVQWAGPRRWVPPGIELSALPPIDAVLISHNHYDHLDDATVRHLAALSTPPRWYAPPRLGSWLARRSARLVTELDWWETADWPDSPLPDGVRITATPAQHFSGRGVTDRNRTLWCGWVVRAGRRAIWFVGDTGRHPLFGEIGRRLGPFDAVLMPIGAYDPQWFMAPVHIAPEDAVAGFGEMVTAAPAGGPQPVMIGMHWGTFKLTDEPMDQPPTRTREAWAAASLPSERLWIPRPGETRVF